MLNSCAPEKINVFTETIHLFSLSSFTSFVGFRPIASRLSWTRCFRWRSVALDDFRLQLDDPLYARIALNVMACFVRLLKVVCFPTRPLWLLVCRLHRTTHFRPKDTAYRIGRNVPRHFITHWITRFVDWLICSIPEPLASITSTGHSLIWLWRCKHKPWR